MIPDRWLEKVLVELCDVVVVAAADVVAGVLDRKSVV